MEATAEAGGITTRQLAADILGISYTAISNYAKRGKIRTYTYTAPDGSQTIPLYSLRDTLAIGLAAKARAEGTEITDEQMQALIDDMATRLIYDLADTEYKATRETTTKQAKTRAAAKKAKQTTTPQQPTEQSKGKSDMQKSQTTKNK